MKNCLSVILLLINIIAKSAISVAVCITIMIVAATPAFADNSTLKGLYFMQKISTTASSVEPPHSQYVDGCFLLSESFFSGSYNGKLVFIGGKAILDCEFDGDIYVYNTEIEFTENFDILNGQIHYVIGDRFPYYVAYLVFGFLQTIIGAVILVTQKRKFSQVASVLIKERSKSFQYGLLILFMFAALIVVFTLSIVGIPIAVLFFLAYMVLAFIGQVPLAICLGRFVSKSDKNRKPLFLDSKNIFICYAVGSVLLDIFRITPYIYDIINFILIPVVGIGSVAVAAVNRYFLKIHHISFFPEAKKEKKDVRSIIVNGNNKNH